MATDPQLTLDFEKPHFLLTTTKGEAFHRVADTKRRLSKDEVRELEIDKGQLDLDLEPAPFKYPQDFDEELLKTFARNWMLSMAKPKEPAISGTP